jgi:hypothetical protein
MAKPIMITEWNANPEYSDAVKVTFTISFMQKLHDSRPLFKTRPGLESMTVRSRDHIKNSEEKSIAWLADTDEHG